MQCSYAEKGEPHHPDGTEPMIEYTQVQPILFPAGSKKLISQKNAARTTIGHSSPVDRRLKSAIVYDNYMSRQRSTAWAKTSAPSLSA